MGAAGARAGAAPATPAPATAAPATAAPATAGPSGTTIIAGEMTGRSIHAIELNPAYVDVAVKRWQDFTGQEAVHEDGRKFNDLVAGEVKEAA